MYDLAVAEAKSDTRLRFLLGAEEHYFLRLGPSRMAVIVVMSQVFRGLLQAA
jgi:hypothetical protein